jgi:hypothetical protein
MCALQHGVGHRAVSCVKESNGSQVLEVLHQPAFVLVSALQLS